MKKYEPQKIESKWQEKWAEEGLYETDVKQADQPFYNLMMFPYPSGEGLHVGHVFAFSGSDSYGRFKRMQGFDVFEPMGFDAFGIHSENYALKVDSHPKQLVEETTSHFKEQLDRAGLGLDWSHSVNTTKKSYYKWSQWLFLQLYKNGLAEKKKAPVNWCPSCKTVLADEQVIQGSCERCDHEVEEKQLKQWFLKITKYADKLNSNLDQIDWPDRIKKLQRNWIGRSEGAKIKFSISGDQVSTDSVKVFTTRPDTLFGATFVVLAPEHELAQEIAEQKPEVEDYIEQAKQKTKEQRTEREKTGLDTGLKAVNPATDEEIPVYVGDFVLSHYGGGAIMAVPAHDQRDFEFAQEHDLEIRRVVEPENEPQQLEQAYEEPGVLVNSGQFNNLNSEQAREEITDWLEQKDLGEKTVTYKLRDWLISRQRYWSPPIPIVYCDKCGEVPVPEEDLPVELPEMENFRPTGTSKSPLATNEEFVNTECPECGGPARRETDVSDNFLDSAWYFLRYPSTDFEDRAFDEDITEKWLPVDMYIGGPEHACLHLMYTRFITMALHDLDLISFEEPFEKFRAHGHITKNGFKMSKSKGNVVNPEEYIEQYGTDCFRMYLLFLGPFTEGGDFSEEGISGVERFLNRVWKLSHRAEQNQEAPQPIKRKLHRTVKKVTEDIESLKFNTAIAALMEYSNDISDLEPQVPLNCVEPLVLMLAPLAPHLAEEIWREEWGNDQSVFKQQWPQYEEELLEKEQFTLVVQVDGQVRDQIEVEQGLGKERAEQLALESEQVQKWVEEQEVKKSIYVEDKLINLVTE